MISGNRDVFELACGKWETKEGRSASQTDIIDLFQTIVQQMPNCTFVVDGLDECAWQEDPTSFFKSIRQAVANTNTRILILSRDEPEIRSGFRAIWTSDNNEGLNEYQIRSEDVRPDTILFSRSEVNKKLANKSETLKNELSQRMADRCEGMFLWVRMLEEQLRSGKNKKQLEATIDQAPTALDHLYDRNWAKISHLPDKDKHRAFSILRWAALALRPLTILEITEALLITDNDCDDLSVEELPDAIDEDYVSSEILGLCGSLLETQKAVPEQDLGSVTICLAHFSVKQYILCNMPAQGGLLIPNERLRTSAETFQSNILAKLCLRYLNFQSVWQESPQFQSDLERRPFRDYAAGSWYYHTREGGPNYEEVIELTNTLFNPKTGKWESWKKWFDANDDKSKMPESQREITSPNPLFYASLLGLRDTVVYLLEETNLGANQVDQLDRTALQAAALKGQTKVVKLLLENAANVNIANREGWTPLNSASYSGHVDVVKLLLENGADMTIATLHGGTPLISASDSGHVDVVKLLLENNADVAVSDEDGFTPLNSAAYNGHVDIVKLLLEKGIDVNIKDTKSGRTPLSWAAENGHEAVIKLLLTAGSIKPDLKDRIGRTPLLYAAKNGNEATIKLLLATNRVDVDSIDYYNSTPLSIAARMGHKDILALLLAKSHALNIQTNFNRTPLW
jgi:ankyrin repeat protein